MAYREYYFDGKKMLDYEDQALIDYDEYYEARSNKSEGEYFLYSRFYEIQKKEKIDGEPNIGYTDYYLKFLEKLKETDLKLYKKKKDFFDNYVMLVKEIDDEFKYSINRLIKKGYTFDPELKKLGHKVAKIDGKNYIGKWVSGDTTLNMGENLLPLQATVSSFEYVAISDDELLEIKMREKKKRRDYKYSCYLHRFIDNFYQTENYIKRMNNNNMSEELINLFRDLSKVKGEIYHYIRLSIDSLGRFDYDDRLRKLSDDKKKELFNCLKEYIRITRNIISLDLEKTDVEEQQKSLI